MCHCGACSWCRVRTKGRGGSGVNETDRYDAAITVRPLGDGSFVANLHPDWTVQERPHGGYLLALLAKTAMADSSLAPLAVTAQFLNAPKVGPVLIRVETVKSGRTVTVVRAVLEQSGRGCVDATITLGSLPTTEPTWTDVPDMPATPPRNAVEVNSVDVGKMFALSAYCDVRLDPATAGFLSGSGTGAPRLRLWAKPRGAEPDLVFALIAGDLSVPVTFNLGLWGWAPTVQLTGLLRAQPAEGWLRLSVESRSVHGQWFDEDTLVVDSTGRLVCQARQLALSPAS